MIDYEELVLDMAEDDGGVADELAALKAKLGVTSAE